MPPAIRPATEADADAIAQAHVDSILTHGPAIYDSAIVNAWGAPRGAEPYLEAMRRGETFFVAMDEGVSLGFSSHRIEADRHRTAIYVRGIATRKGIGSLLLQRAIDVALCQGASDVWVDASLIAVQFYQKNGFAVVGGGLHRLQAGLEMQCVHMRKTLGSAEHTLHTAEHVELAPYDRTWPQQYQHEAELIRESLGFHAGFSIEHVGSTAIPGMPSKPIIDIVVGVDDVTTIPPPAHELWRMLGYEWGHETNQSDEWLYFIKRDPKGVRVSQLHVVPAKSAFFKRIVHFRDVLRADPHEAEQYRVLKETLARDYRNERVKYRDGKSEFVHRVSRKTRSDG